MEALAITAIGAGLGAFSNRVPGGALIRNQVLLRDLEAQARLYRWDPEQAAGRILRGEMVIVNMRPQSRDREPRLEGAIRIGGPDTSERIRLHAPELIGKDVLLVGPSLRKNDARSLAQRLKNEAGVRACGTLRGGWETRER